MYLLYTYTVYKNCERLHLIHTIVLSYVYILYMNTKSLYIFIIAVLQQIF